MADGNKPLPTVQAMDATQSNGQLSDDANESTLPVRNSFDGGNKFQSAVTAWRSLDLSKLVRDLDHTAEEMVDQQKESLVQRKDLAQKTKDFRKLDDANKLGQIKDLLKAYQSYIDVVTTHNKSITAAFMQAYSPLAEAPDPYPLLEASIDSLITADEVVPKLEAENVRIQTQITALNEQLEEAEQRTEDERKKREALTGTQDDQIKKVEQSWQSVLREKEDNWAAKERGLESRIENQDRLLKELKASYEVSQRLEMSGDSAQSNGRNAGSAAELEILNSELERTSVRLVEVEARNEQLRVELAQSTSQSSVRHISVEDDPAYLRLRSENSSLLRRLDTARYDKEAEKTALQNKIRAFEREVAALKTDRETLQAKVQKWSDYEEVKRELDMLRAIEFTNVESGDAEETTNANGNGDKGETLEQLLAARNKKLNNELTELRVAHTDLQRRMEQLQEDLSGTNMDLEKAQLLNSTLENDIQKTQQEISNAFETMSVAGTYTSRYPAKSVYGSLRGGRTSPTSSIIGGYEGGGANNSRVLESLRSGEASNMGSASILPLVTAQRDRFKKKISDLELELQKQYKTVTSLRSEVSSLQRDNLNLYEKSRYVSSYNRGSSGPTAAGSGSTYGANPNPNSISVSSPTSGAPGLDRYRSSYEDSLNSPFAAFRGRESARALKRMGWPERAVFQATRLLLATRTSRNLFAAYCIALHVLVLFMLFSGGSSTHIVPSGPPSIKDFVPDVGGAADDGAPTWDEEIHS
jgi:homeobox protein cut-like